MKNAVKLEDIEEMRRREGIVDIQLQDEIRELGIGDLVKLTFLLGPKTFETLPVRITSIRGDVFRGKLVNGPAAPGLSQLRVGSAVVFTTAHIHSLSKRQLTHEQ